MNLSILLMVVALAAPPSSVQDLVWMSGCWASVGGEAGSGETWTAPAGGTLLGVSRTVKRGKTVAHEFMQIRETGSGQIAFIALPSGQTEANFPLVRLSGQEAVFENPQHDFPQRVIYRRNGDLLTGRVEGSEGGETKGFDFPMKRCQ
ncbi:MAG TPA: DUF6265 family protein [Thermoanaerobaculia bacterium]|nr:DUF6265 family protein [Thermoanaerobaculia bacterium]